MKKLIATLITATVALGACSAFAACSAEDDGWDGELIEITCLNENAQKETKKVPLNPNRVAILDYAVLDMMDLYGVGDKVVSSCSGTLDYLQDYWDKMSSGEIVDLGNLKQYSMEKLQQSEPDIIFIGGRQSANYAAMEEIAPVVYLAATEGNLVETTLENAETVRKIFGKTDAEVQAIFGDYDFDGRIAALKEVSGANTATPQNAMVLMYNSSESITAIGSNGRCSLISTEVGFKLQEVADSGSQHGSQFNWETIMELNPDYIFVLNRGFITESTDNNSVLNDIVNKLTKPTTAAQNNHIIVLNSPDAWYTASGGLQALNTMFEDLEAALLSNN